MSPMGEDTRRSGLDLDRETMLALADPCTAERMNEAVRGPVVESGLAMMSSTRLRGVYALRLRILNHRTNGADASRTVEAVEAADRGALAGARS